MKLYRSFSDTLYIGTCGGGSVCLEKKWIEISLNTHKMFFAYKAWRGEFGCISVCVVRNWVTSVGCRILNRSSGKELHTRAVIQWKGAFYGNKPPFAPHYPTCYPIKQAAKRIPFSTTFALLSSMYQSYNFRAFEKCKLTLFFYIRLWFVVGNALFIAVELIFIFKRNCNEGFIVTGKTGA